MSPCLFLYDKQVRPVPIQPKIFRFPQRSFGVKKPEQRRVLSTLGSGFITMTPKISRFVTDMESRQGKLRSRNLDEACFTRR